MDIEKFKMGFEEKIIISDDEFRKKFYEMAAKTFLDPDVCLKKWGEESLELVDACRECCDNEKRCSERTLHFIEEIADVIITTIGIAYSLEFTLEDIKKAMYVKIKRQLDRLESEEKKNTENVDTGENDIDYTIDNSGMTTDEMIRNLRSVKTKYDNVTTYRGDINISSMLRDILYKYLV